MMPPKDKLDLVLDAVNDLKDACDKRMVKMESAIYGTGEDDPGINIKVDRLTQDRNLRDKRSERVMGVAISALTAGLLGLGAAIWSLLTTGSVPPAR